MQDLMVYLAEVSADERGIEHGVWIKRVDMDMPNRVDSPHRHAIIECMLI